MSWRDLLAPARHAAPHSTPSAAQEAEARAAEQAQPGWQGFERVAADMEFNGLRLHADTEAAELTHSFGARAFTYGHDVFLGANAQAQRCTETGELLAHEAVHVAQQAAQGSPALQFAPKPGGKAGPGAAPPDEDLIRDPDDWGAEDDHILFKQDDLALNDAELVAFAAKQTEPVSIQLHGSSSEEGSSDYNLNLSAQRGVAVRHRLMELLPAGSRVVVFAHGESRHFSAAEQNRRVGMSLIGPAESSFTLGQGLALGRRIVRPPFTLTPGGSPSPVVPPVGNFTPPSAGPITDPKNFLAPLPSGPLIPYYLMDNPTLLAPSSLHGGSAAETGNLVEQYGAAYLKYRGLGIPDEYELGPLDLGAASLANKEVKNSIQAYWERNDPTIIEQSNASVDAHVLTYDLRDLFRDKPKKPKDPDKP